MKDFMRVPANVQAVRLPILLAIIRRVCYALAQRGNHD